MKIKSIMFALVTTSLLLLTSGSAFAYYPGCTVQDLNSQGTICWLDGDIVTICGTCDGTFYTLDGAVTNAGTVDDACEEKAREVCGIRNDDGDTLDPVYTDDGGTSEY